MKVFENTIRMIQTKLLLIEYATVNDTDQNHWKLAAIRSIRSLLLELDLSAEIVPTSNLGRLKSLLVSLKGDQLSKDESKLLEELVVI
jgi:hypothetical protein